MASASLPLRLLIVESRYYPEISDELLAGAREAILRAEAEHDRITVPGALEIPSAIAMSLEGKVEYDGYVALGCVIRGETSHYDIVAGESAKSLMNLSVERGLAVGNGILTCENFDQARERAEAKGKNKGGKAAEAALAMIAVRRRFGA